MKEHVRATGQWILIQRLKPEEKVGSLFLPKELVTGNKGTILSIGPRVDDYGFFEGQVVYWAEYAGQEIHEGEDLWLLKGNDILLTSTEPLPEEPVEDILTCTHSAETCDSTGPCEGAETPVNPDQLVLDISAKDISQYS
jgi:co-chaperonin GroES (HSP10)